MSSRGKPSESEYNAAQAKCYAEGAADCVGGKVDIDL